MSNLLIIKANWIKVSDNPPPIYKFVLCYMDDHSMMVLERDKDFNYFPVIHYDPYFVMFNRMARVTHWMELPKPPEKVING